MTAAELYRRAQRVTLSPEESLYCCQLGQARGIRDGYADRTPDVRQNLNLVERHIISAKAEFAVSKVTGATFRDDVLVGGDGDTADLTFRDRITIAVKYRTEQNRDFAISRNSPTEYNDDIGILVWPYKEGESATDQTDFLLIGWCLREQFRTKAKVLKFGSQIRVGLQWDHMNPMDELVQVFARFK